MTSIAVVEVAIPGLRGPPGDSAIAAGSSGQFQWNYSGEFAGAPLWRTDANTVSQHNGVDAQTWQLYRTRTDDLNGEWLEANTPFFGVVPYVR